MTMVYMYSGQSSVLLRKYNFYLEIITRDLSIYTMDHPEFILANHNLHFIYLCSLKIVFVYTLKAASQLDLHYLPKYTFRSHWYTKS